ncbi:MAG TPA: DUF5028 domain-containing protein [Bacilli bacterium]|nr:DUF5028 domain-containing protein [Bacilli bacterium]
MKRIIFSTLSIVLLIGIGFRIWHVNQAVDLPPVNNYTIGEEVAIGDNVFLDNFENMKGYSVIVNQAEILPYEDFLEKYNYIDDEEAPLFEEGDTFYPEMVYDLNITVKNTNQTEDPMEHSGINFLHYNLYGTDLVLQISNMLYLVANPELEYGVTDGFRLRPNSEMDFNLPYFYSPSDIVQPIQTKAIERDQVYLVVSMHPVVNRILIE